MFLRNPTPQDTISGVDGFHALLQKLPVGSMEGVNLVVTGGARGIGHACCELVLSLGGNAIAFDKSLPDEADRTDGIIYIDGDASVEGDYAKLAKHIQDRAHGRVDLLICGAAIVGDPKTGVVHRFSVQEMIDVITVNAIGPALTVKMLTPFLVRGKSMVIFCSSVLACPLIPTGAPGSEEGIIAYQMAKAALEPLAHDTERQLGIRAYLAHLGAVRTRMTEHKHPAALEFAKNFADSGHAFEPTKIARAFAHTFLLSPESKDLDWTDGSLVKCLQALGYPSEAARF